MWVTPSEIDFEIIGLTKTDLQSHSSKIQEVLAKHLLPEERLLDFRVLSTPTYTDGPQVTCTVRFTSALPEFLVKISGKPWNIWPFACENDDFVVVQHVDGLVFPPVKNGIASVRLRKAQVVLVSTRILRRVSDEEGIDLLRDALPLAHQTELTTLQYVLGNFQEALTFAASFISSFATDIPAYAAKLVEELSLLRQPPDFSQAPIDIAVAVIKNNLAYLNQTNSSAARLLGIIVVSGGQAVPTELFTGAKHLESTSNLLLLERCGLVSVSNATVDVEPLLQLVAREWYQSADLRAQLEREAYELVARRLPHAVGDWDEISKYVPVAEVVLAIRPRSTISKFNRATVLSSVVRYPASRCRGVRPDTTARGQEALALRREIFGQFEKGYLVSQERAGRLILDLSPYDKALNDASWAIEDGENDLLAANRAAISLLRDGLADLKRFLGDAHPQTATQSLNLAAALMRNREWRSARQTVEKVLEMQEEILGLSDWKLLASFSLILEAAKLESTQVIEDYPYISMVCERQLAKYESALGSTDQKTIVVEDMYANVYGEYGPSIKLRAVVTERLHRSLYEKAAKTFGKQSVDAIDYLSHLAFAMSWQEKYAEADAAFSEVLPLMEEEFGVNARATVFARSELGLARFMLGEYDSAVALMQTALSGMATSYGPDHEITQNCRRMLEAALQNDPRPLPPMVIPPKKRRGLLAGRPISFKSSAPSEASNWSFRSAWTRVSRW